MAPCNSVQLNPITPKTKQETFTQKIMWGFGTSPFGLCLLATTPEGICFLGFTSENKKADALQQLHNTWQGAPLVEDSERIQSIVDDVFERRGPTKNSTPIHLRGTSFQQTVWRGLLHIPKGTTVSYQDLASFIGRPTATRAVASAIAQNPVSYLIPCHRVIAKNGKIHQYRWGTVTKKELLRQEGVFIERQ